MHTMEDVETIYLRVYLMEDVETTYLRCNSQKALPCKSNFTSVQIAIWSKEVRFCSAAAAVKDGSRHMTLLGIAEGVPSMLHRRACTREDVETDLGRSNETSLPKTRSRNSH